MENCKDQRNKSKGVRKRDGKDDNGSKKHKHSDKENPAAKSIRTVTPNLNKTVSESEQETKTKVIEPVDARSNTTKAAKPEKSITTTKVMTKPEKSVTALKACLHETKTKPDGICLRNLIAKAQHKIQEKRHIDHRREHITRKRIATRLALNQVVPTVCFDDHLNYLRELEQLGCTFIHDEVDCLKMFSLLSRSGYNGISNSIFVKNKNPWCDDEASRRKKQQRSTKGKNMEHSLQDSQIRKNGESAESSHQRQSKCQSSTSVRI